MTIIGLPPVRVERERYAVVDLVIEPLQNDVWHPNLPPLGCDVDVRGFEVLRNVALI